MMQIPQAKLDQSLLEVGEICIEQNSDYHLVVLSHPRTWERQMLITTFVPDWNKDMCFHFCWDDIDTEMIKMHVLWKFTADPNYVLHFKVKCDITAKTADQLNLNTWRFV